MKVKKFYRTQREIASAINETIDEYWRNRLSDEELEQTVKMLYENNQDKIVKSKDFTTIVKQQCGKNRLSVVSRIIDLNKEELTRQ